MLILWAFYFINPKIIHRWRSRVASTSVTRITKVLDSDTCHRQVTEIADLLKRPSRPGIPAMLSLGQAIPSGRGSFFAKGLYRHVGALYLRHYVASA
jgi:hypothetical protein